MSIFGLLIALVLFGAMLYLLELIPMDATVRQVVRVVAIIVLILWVLQVLFGAGLGVHGPLLRPC